MIFTAENIGFGSGIIRRYSLEQSNQGCRETIHEERVKPYGFVYRGMIQGSNMAFRRACLEAAGPFDERFGAGTPYAGEEWDVAVRACRAGWSGGYFPVPTVDHNHGRRDAETRQRDLYYSFGGGAVYAKNLMAPGKLRLIPAFLKDFIKVPDWTHRLRLAKGLFDFFYNSKTRR
jgi:GT2 family glycosyltransferase